MNIVVLVKQVPDTWSERKLTDADHTLDRESADAVLDEINERAVEEALLIKEKEGGDSTVTVLTGLPGGDYCDVIHGSLAAGRCSGPTVHVNAAGRATITVGAKDSVAFTRQDVVG